MFQSTKLVDGFSTCFRQWKAEDTHCKFLHGYSISFKLIFEAEELDFRNWVVDFGFQKRSKSKVRLIDDSSNTKMLSVKEWFDYMFDHTTLISKDDPELENFIELHKKEVLQLRVLDGVGCELFAKFVFDEISDFINIEFPSGRIRLVSVECKEHEKNSAIYKK